MELIDKNLWTCVTKYQEKDNRLVNPLPIITGTNLFYFELDKKEIPLSDLDLSKRDKKYRGIKDYINMVLDLEDFEKYIPRKYTINNTLQNDFVHFVEDNEKYMINIDSCFNP